jgi:glycine oxidase
MTKTPTSDVIIIGGGIIGCALAESLAREKLSVEVVERGLIGREASWAAAGMLAPQSEMPEPGPWFDFCLAARRLYPETIDRIRESTQIDPQYRAEGMFYAAFDAEEESSIRARAAWQRPLGLVAREMPADEAIAREPALAREIRSAVHFAEDHQLDPRLMTRGFAIAARKLGVRLLEFSPVTRLIVEGGRAIGVEVAGEKRFAGRVILAGGCWSGAIDGIGFDLPVFPVKGQMLLLQLDRPKFDHVLHSARVYLVPRLDGRVVIGSTEERGAGFDKSVRAGALSHLLDCAYELAPCLREAALADSWAGLRPGTPDKRPILGACEIENFILATGHFRNGVLLAPITARLLADFIFSNEISETMRLFSIERFEEKSRREALQR